MNELIRFAAMLVNTAQYYYYLENDSSKMTDTGKYSIWYFTTIFGLIAACVRLFIG